MQIILDDMIMNNSGQKLSLTENQKIESICQQLKNICTVSSKLLTPQPIYKRIKKQRVLKKMSKTQSSEEESCEIQQKKRTPNCSELSRKELEEKIALINGLQQQIQQLKCMMSQIQEVI
ncbi:unnamed protein product (macronuclear) [Paramecium tetraurelia]|uniref:Uncharacterized protein n=1 Tax=Paramecium tetraurelia TaxID=5888 RepID=A0E538_PARTE|nr:uncharacterized protein GSPATT00023582001 [Paramecium tetraurelia]CAK90405.1 unnamed protein product [Paramecium tetraurelia]|eukprot:XP_001457802.1 hypothetical protein (macronuclear) [Paramecium tetraurelia strain d4-2]